MQAIVQALSIPIILLNVFGGIASGIWLAVQGQWWAIGYGFLVALFSRFFLGVAMLPGLLFGGPAAILAEKGRYMLATPFVVLSQIYTYAVITVWCLWVLHLFISNSGTASFVALLIWSYGVALGPLMYQTQQEVHGGGGEGALMTTFVAQIAYIAVMLFLLLSSGTLATIFMLFGAIMCVGAFVQSIITITLLVSMHKQSRLS